MDWLSGNGYGESERTPRKAIFRKKKMQIQKQVIAAPNRIYFWGEKYGYGYFSQWYESPIKLRGHSFPTAEHAMMAAKAIWFDDMDALEKVLVTKSPREVKAIGRKVKNFNQGVWDKTKYSIVYNINFYKFVQNADLLQKLYDTNGYQLIEASPKDSIWGSGLSEKEHLQRAKENNYEYPGQNLLGEILTKLRNNLMTGRVEFLN